MIFDVNYVYLFWSLGGFFYVFVVNVCVWEVCECVFSLLEVVECESELILVRVGG